MPLRLIRSTSLTTSFSRKTNGSGRLSSAQHSPYIRFQCLLSGSPKRPVIVQKRNRVQPVLGDLPTDFVRNQSANFMKGLATSSTRSATCPQRRRREIDAI